MNRREFISFAALTGLAAAPASAGALSVSAGHLRCQCTPMEEPVDADQDDRDAPAGFRLDLLGPAADERRGTLPGFGLKAIYAGLLRGHEFVLVHPAAGDFSRAGSLHFARNSLAGLEVQWSGRRTFVPLARLFGHRRRPGRYRLEIAEPGGDRLALQLRVVAA